MALVLRNVDGTYARMINTGAVVHYDYHDNRTFVHKGEIYHVRYMWILQGGTLYVAKSIGNITYASCIIDKTTDVNYTIWRVIACGDNYICHIIDVHQQSTILVDIDVASAKVSVRKRFDRFYNHVAYDSATSRIWLITSADNMLNIVDADNADTRVIDHDVTIWGFPNYVAIYNGILYLTIFPRRTPIMYNIGTGEFINLLGRHVANCPADYDNISVSGTIMSGITHTQGCDVADSVEVVLFDLRTFDMYVVDTVDGAAYAGYIPWTLNT